MWKSEDYVLAHCKRVYGTRILYRNRAFYIKTVDDVYKIDLSLADKHIYQFHSMTKPLTFTETSLARAFFKLSALSAYKEANCFPNLQDWEQFLNDAYRYEFYLEELNG